MTMPVLSGMMEIRNLPGIRNKYNLITFFFRGYIIELLRLFQTNILRPVFTFFLYNELTPWKQSQETEVIIIYKFAANILFQNFIFHR
jgi:hypothetical protein